MRVALGLAAVLWTATSTPALAQGTEPLRKTDVIRLMTSSLIGKGEVADLIRRNCLSFVPTERDWADFRRVGADAEIMGSIGACSNRRRTFAGTTLEPVHAAPLQARIVAAPGSAVDARVLLTRGERMLAGARLVLRGSGQVIGGGAPDASAVTDDRGVALFRFPVGRVAGAFALRVALAEGPDVQNQAVVDLLVRPGAPARAQVQPSRLDLDSAGDVTVAVAVSDSFGNPVSDEPVQLRGSDSGMSLATATRTTDSLGRATFVVRPRSVSRAGTLSVGVRGATMATVEAAFSERASATGSGFVGTVPLVGTASTALESPLVFQARDADGRPLPGRVVAFRAYNAQVEPDRVATDAAGLARVQVTLGPRTGTAVVTAAVDSVQSQATLRVTPGAATEVILEENHVRVNGGHLFVTADTTFVLRVSVKDANGNAAPIGALARALDNMRDQFNARSRLLRILSVESDEWASQVTFRPLGRGSAPLTLADATVTVDVVARGGAAR